MRSIQIYDTTLRDGTQGEGISLSLQDKLQITERLDEIGVNYCGRYGDWAYLWTDDSFKSGERAAETALSRL